MTLIEAKTVAKRENSKLRRSGTKAYVMFAEMDGYEVIVCDRATGGCLYRVGR